MTKPFRIKFPREYEQSQLFGKKKVWVVYGGSLLESQKKALELGWKPPRWWEIHRFTDNPSTAWAVEKENKVEKIEFVIGD